MLKDVYLNKQIKHLLIFGQDLIHNINQVYMKFPSHLALSLWMVKLQCV